MRIYQIALFILIFSLLTSVFNELAVFDQQLPEIGLAVNESEISGVFEINTDDQFDSEESFIENIPFVGGLQKLTKMWNIVKNILKNTLLLGEVFKIYVPGDVGSLFGDMITAITLIIYTWGGIQMLLNRNTKGMD